MSIQYQSYCHNREINCYLMVPHESCVTAELKRKQGDTLTHGISLCLRASQVRKHNCLKGKVVQSGYTIVLMSMKLTKTYLFFGGKSRIQIYPS